MLSSLAAPSSAPPAGAAQQAQPSAPLPAKRKGSAPGTLQAGREAAQEHLKSLEDLHPFSSETALGEFFDNAVLLHEALEEALAKLQKTEVELCRYKAQDRAIHDALKACKWQKVIGDSI